MSDDKIKYTINQYNNDYNPYFDINKEAWIFILNDVLHKRRFNKLNKIINNIL